ncbi:hypothetical protein [Campylobacter mucosalis]|uniref:hypothetical protein n=1 Tax=Campylobacter mucosalis TaxID=202 RepID=UPI00201E4A67|nr:hypothetical protein [Campylobacter mucosalis]
MKCPKCGSENIKKERINARNVGADFDKEIDTGDRICQDCGFIGTNFEFENIIKKVCKELNLTYKQLGELIGYGEEAVSKAARTDNISATMNKALSLYLENLELKNKLKTLDTLSKIIKELSK